MVRARARDATMARARDGEHMSNYDKCTGNDSEHREAHDDESI